MINGLWLNTSNGKYVRDLLLIWVYITNSYVLDGHLIKYQSAYIRAKVKSQVCEIGTGRVWIKMEINSLSSCKWDVLYHRYDRGIMGNEFCVILMILLSYTIIWSRMKKLNYVKFSPSRSLARSLSFSLSLMCRTVDLGTGCKRADGTHDFFPFIHFLSATQENFSFFLFLKSIDFSLNTK